MNQRSFVRLPWDEGAIINLNEVERIYIRREESQIRIGFRQKAAQVAPHLLSPVFATRQDAIREMDKIWDLFPDYMKGPGNA